MLLFCFVFFFLTCIFVIICFTNIWKLSKLIEEKTNAAVGLSVFFEHLARLKRVFLIQNTSFTCCCTRKILPRKARNIQQYRLHLHFPRPKQQFGRYFSLSVYVCVKNKWLFVIFAFYCYCFLLLECTMIERTWTDLFPHEQRPCRSDLLSLSLYPIPPNGTAAAAAAKKHKRSKNNFSII